MTNNNSDFADESRPYLWVKKAFEDRKKRNPKFSLRAFAKLLEISSGRISEILSNKRDITKNTGIKIAEKLGFTEDEKFEFLKCIDAHLKSVKDSKKQARESNQPDKYEYISDTKFQIISDWEHLAILAAIELDDFVQEVDWIAKRLKLEVGIVKDALDRLMEIGVVTIGDKGWVINSGRLKTSNDVTSLAQQRFHDQTLRRARSALKNIPVEDRDISSMTITIDKSKLPIAKKMIKEFRRSLAKVLESGSKQEVYSLNVQLVPIVGLDEDEQEEDFE